jgi:hypothetical protein
LNLWGFKRITQGGADSGAYYHELFLRSKTFLCRDIIRTTPREGETSTRVPSNPEAEPKFYSMMTLPPSGSTSVSAHASVSAPFNLPVNAKDTNTDPMATVAPPASIPAASISHLVAQVLVSDDSSSPCLESMHVPTHGVEVGIDNTANEALWSDKLPSGMPGTHSSTSNMTSMHDVRASNMSSLNDLQASISEIDHRTILLQQMLMRNDRSSSMRQINKIRDKLSRNASQSSVDLQLQSQGFPPSHPTDSRENALDRKINQMRGGIQSRNVMQSYIDLQLHSQGFSPSHPPGSRENAVDRSIREMRGGIQSRNVMQSSINSRMQSQGFLFNRQADGRAAANDRSIREMRGSMLSRNCMQSALNSQPYSQGFPASHPLNSREVALDRGINDRFSNQYGTNHYQSVEPFEPQHSNFNRADSFRSDSFRSNASNFASDKFQSSHFNRTDLLRSYPFGGSSRSLLRSDDSFRSMNNTSNNPSDKFQSSHFNRTDLLRSYPFGGSSRSLLRSDDSFRSMNNTSNNPSDKFQSSHFNRTDLLRSYPFGGSSQTLLQSDDSFRSMNNASNDASDKFQSSHFNRADRSGSPQKLLHGLEEEICTGPEPVPFSEAVPALSPTDKGSLLEILTKIH